ncbi:MAG: hypothetical protein ACI4S2_15185 [Lachnospiraceae bacterium]
MTKILAQHGAAKGKKIDTAIADETLSGAIFAPREESFDSIEKYYLSNEALFPDTCFLDPQLYYSTFEGKIFKHLEDSPDFPTDITRRDWRKKTPKLIQYLDEHANRSSVISSSLITPGFYIQGLDWKFDYSLDIYEYCFEHYGFEHYYLSLLISNSFFHSKSDVDEMIEDITDNIDNKDGIYFSICYEKMEEKNYEFTDAQNLANILYFVYSLKKLGFNIIVGYTFINSVLFAMLDCQYVATGWFNNLRKFKKDRFEEASNVGRRKKRYTSLPLFTYITLKNLNLISENDDMSIFLSDCDIDEYILDDQDSVSFVDLEQQYWQALSIFIDKINTRSTVSEKVDFVLSEIRHAKTLYNDILESLTDDDRETYNRIKSNASHLDPWIMAIETFKNRISLL